jgi:hypothetical protein
MGWLLCCTWRYKQYATVNTIHGSVSFQRYAPTSFRLPRTSSISRGFWNASERFKEQLNKKSRWSSQGQRFQYCNKSAPDYTHEWESQQLEKSQLGITLTEVEASYRGMQRRRLWSRSRGTRVSGIINLNPTWIDDFSLVCERLSRFGSSSKLALSHNESH